MRRACEGNEAGRDTALSAIGNVLLAFPPSPLEHSGMALNNKTVGDERHVPDFRRTASLEL